MHPGGYFEQTQFVSNSTLKDLSKLLYGGVEIANLQKIYDFGSLIDAHLTEEDQVGKFEYLFDEAEINTALLMKQAGLGDPFLKRMLDTCQKQHEIYRNSFDFEWQGWKLALPVRIKIDFRRKGVMLGDLKSTFAKTNKDFEEAIRYFDYDQQAAFYLDVDGTCDKFMFVGISKSEDRKGVHKVFRYAVSKGDKVYESGKRKYSLLMYKYYFLIHHLNFNEKVFPSSMDCIYN